MMFERATFHHTRISRNYPDHLSGMLRSLPRRIEQVRLSISSLSVLPSPVNRRVGIHDFTFEACSSFTRVTACKIARPPKGGLLSRGFDLASHPTKPLGSYHVLPTTTWMDPPSTGDLRRWGALLTIGGNIQIVRGPRRTGPPSR